MTRHTFSRHAHLKLPRIRQLKNFFGPIETRFDVRRVFRIIKSASAGVKAGLTRMKQHIPFQCRSGESLGVEVGAFGFVFRQTSFTLSGVLLTPCTSRTHAT